ncbi:hypothetical protein GUJ93_ZPchr0002g23779 [Zizania palustris]|uniref:Uncharacterized protein n=1 Tax=Zizania palustris TaxID=103762 RepID=A0A8J5RH06_ZIZPA|nr:hypothetical protein GUJ93_ZPchr0002g23779 [Zizania palustris]
MQHLLKEASCHKTNCSTVGLCRLYYGMHLHTCTVRPSPNKTEIHLTYHVGALDCETHLIIFTQQSHREMKYSKFVPLDFFFYMHQVNLPLWACKAFAIGVQCLVTLVSTTDGHEHFGHIPLWSCSQLCTS